MQTSEIASPVVPARPVRPMRWMYASGTSAARSSRRTADPRCRGRAPRRRSRPGPARPARKLERPRSLALRAIGVDRDGLDAVADQVAREAGGRDLRPGEHQDLVPVVVADQVGEQGACGRDRPGRPAGGPARRGCCAARPRRSPDRQEGRREPPDLLRERRREQQVLALAGESSTIRRMSGRKPMSSIRSASSRTRTSTCSRLTTCWPTWSSSRPGWRRGSRPRRRTSRWGPPDAAVHDGGGAARSVHTARTLVTCIASSRVGVMIRP